MTDQASHMRHNEQAIDSTHHAHHIVPTRVYLIVISVLMVLTAFTVWIAFRDLGSTAANIVMALGVATVKATIVALWFMHVKYSGKLIHLTIATSLIFMLIMIFGVLMDVWTRPGHVIEAGYTLMPEFEQVTEPHGDHGPEGSHGNDAEAH